VAVLATAPCSGWLDALGLFEQSYTMWLKLPQYRQRPSSILFWYSLGDKQHPAAERSMGMGPKWLLPLLVGWGAGCAGTRDILWTVGMDVGLFCPKEWWDSALHARYCMSYFCECHVVGPLFREILYT
jgi:hypothetical protein